MANPDLDARYGRTPSTARRTRLTVIASGIAFVVVFAAWLAWGGLLGTPAQFEARNTGFTIDSPAQVTVQWNFTAEPGADARCAVQALNSTFAIIGWKVVDLPAAAARTREFTQSVRTTEKAVTGLIYRCWLT